MIPRGSFLKHDKFMDICIRVDKAPIRLSDGRYVIRGTFWNMGFVDSFNLNIKFSRKIEAKDLRENYTVTMMRPDEPCLRKNNWVKI